MNWTSSRATIEFCYREVKDSPGVYNVIVRAFKKICEKCKVVGDVELDPIKEANNDRLLLIMAYELRVLMEKNDNLKECFQMSL